MDGEEGRLERELSFSLVRGGPLYFALRRTGVIPEGGLGIGRRVALITGAAALPVAALAWWSGQLVPAQGTEALLHQYGVLTKMLVGILLLIVADAAAERVFPPIGLQLLNSHILPEEETGRLREAIEGARRARDSWLALALILALVAAGVVFRTSEAMRWHELSWALTTREGRTALSAAGWWYLLISNPIYQVLALEWAWRLGVVAVLFARLGRLALSPVPTHPDRAGGLQFLEYVAVAFVPFAFALSAVMSAHLGHDILEHGQRVESLRVHMAVFAVLLVGAILAPFLLFIPRLARARRRALHEYSALTARHDRLVQGRWVRREAVRDDDGMLSAPELGPLADVASMFHAVERTKVLPLGRTALLWLALAVLLPMLPVILIQIPVQEILERILRGVL